MLWYLLFRAWFSPKVAAPPPTRSSPPSTARHKSVPGGLAGTEASLSGAVEAVVRPWMAQAEAPGVMVVVRSQGLTRFRPLRLGYKARRRPVTLDSVVELTWVPKVFTRTTARTRSEASRCPRNFGKEPSGRSPAGDYSGAMTVGIEMNWPPLMCHPSPHDWHQ